MPLDFVAIDFETANPKRASVCQIGLAKVRGGKVISTYCGPVRPPEPHTSFHPRNIAVHGLTPRTVVGAQGWEDTLVRLISYTGNLPLVGHNVSVERSVITQATEAVGGSVPDFTYLCTQALAKAHLDTGPYGLEPVAIALGLPDFNHHDAGEDAMASARIVLELADRTGTDDLGLLWGPGQRRRAA